MSVYTRRSTANDRGRCINFVVKNDARSREVHFADLRPAQFGAILAGRFTIEMHLNIITKSPNRWLCLCIASWPFIVLFFSAVVAAPL